VTGSSDTPLWTGVAVLAIVLGIVGVFIRPFLFEPIAAILLLISSKQTASQRLTRPGIIVITVCAVVGAAIAAAGGHALY
jgi:hypothetical protein